MICLRAYSEATHKVAHNAQRVAHINLKWGDLDIHVVSTFLLDGNISRHLSKDHSKLHDHLFNHLRHHLFLLTRKHADPFENHFL